MARAQVTVVNRALGQPTVIRPHDGGMEAATRAGLFNRISSNRLNPQADEGLVDSNSSPVLLWTPATQDPAGLISGSIGSQADSMHSVSRDYERWVNRVMTWVRRNGTKVWGLETHRTRPDLDVRRTDVTTVLALPAALASLERGTAAH